VRGPKTHAGHNTHIAFLCNLELQSMSLLTRSWPRNACRSPHLTTCLWQQLSWRSNKKQQRQRHRNRCCISVVLCYHPPSQAMASGRPSLSDDSLRTNIELWLVCAYWHLLERLITWCPTFGKRALGGWVGLGVGGYVCECALLRGSTR